MDRVGEILHGVQTCGVERRHIPETKDHHRGHVLDVARQIGQLVRDAEQERIPPNRLPMVSIGRSRITAANVPPSRAPM